MKRTLSLMCCIRSWQRAFSCWTKRSFSGPTKPHGGGVT